LYEIILFYYTNKNKTVIEKDDIER